MNMNHAPVEDTYFFDPLSALRASLSAIPIPGADRLPICYYNGQQIPDGPLNLIHLPFTALSEFFFRTPLPLPRKIDFGGTFFDESPEQRQQVVAAFDELLSGIEEARRQVIETKGFLPASDSYFLDRATAYQCALQAARVDLSHPVITGLQLCYHDGEPIANAPPNLVHLPAEEVVPVLTNTRLRLPTVAVPPGGASTQEKSQIDQLFQQLLEEINARRRSLVHSLMEKCLQDSPGPFGERLRIFLAASRKTLVMQHASRGFARAFAELGHDVRFEIEQNDMEEITALHILDATAAHRPHVTFNINHANNEWLHPEVVNVMWWQDPMPRLVQNNPPITFRERDIVLSYDAIFDEYLRKAGAETIHRQGFCIDSDIFKPNSGVGRENKIVFVGSSYRQHMEKLSGPLKQACNRLMAEFCAGKALTKELVTALAIEFDLEFDSLFFYRLNYVIRDTSVRWLCELSEKLGIPVEIYGNYWDEDPVVKPFYRGRLEHGAAVAAVYNSARYALVCMPQEVNTQRLAEVFACGCCPVVYDVRVTSTLPHWDDNCLYYRTREELESALRAAPLPPTPEGAAEHFSYKNAARQVLDLVRNAIKTPPSRVKQP